ncbi:hypothetical protein FTO68_00650 [Methanocalculus taiwanensis]|uniref:Uncharacterized protein n=1 Tax=Methanocalculus taiwanensis TaxID=106207 RepID=A0ABD4TH22_9EURY|nr:hypothetical protein [Methanocalculus taiwanensis]MCQ1537504.1 hypothetical protein [Methanocalculus taiwanensis]
MVGDGASLYTIEGLAAGLLMIATAAIVLQSISVYTPGDTHIDDMLLEQLGADALAVLDLPVEPDGRTQLEVLLHNGDDGSAFHEAFYPLLRMRSFAPDDPVQYAASISFRDGDEGVVVVPYTSAASHTGAAPYTGRDPAIRVSRWVHLQAWHGLPPPIPNRDQMALLEVILWRG